MKFQPIKYVGVFGGTFDPPHLGHSYVINEFIKLGGSQIEAINIIPSHDHPYGKIPTASFEDRLTMCDHFAFDFYVKNNVMCNVKNMRACNLKYSFEYLDYINQIYNDGSDYDFRYLPVLLIGGDITEKEIKTKWWNGDKLIRDYPVFSAERNEKSISSTYIRNLIKEENYIPDKNTLSKSVAAYIKEKELYGYKNE